MTFVVVVVAVAVLLGGVRAEPPAQLLHSKDGLLVSLADNQRFGVAIGNNDPQYLPEDGAASNARVDRIERELGTSSSSSSSSSSSWPSVAESVAKLVNFSKADATSSEDRNGVLDAIKAVLDEIRVDQNDKLTVVADKVTEVAGKFADLMTNDNALSEALITEVEKQTTSLATMVTLLMDIKAGLADTQNEGGGSTAAVPLATWVDFTPRTVYVKGGETITVAGRGFIVDYPKLYKCRFHRRGEATGPSVVSEPATVLSSTMLKCTMPKWSHPFDTVDFQTSMTLLENDQPVNFFAGVDNAPVMQYVSESPTMTDLTNNGVGQEFLFPDLPNGKAVVTFEVDDPDHDTADITVTGTSSDTCAQLTIPTKTTKERTAEFAISTPDCESTVSLTVTDDVGKTSSQTFKLQVWNKRVIELKDGARKYNDGTAAATCNGYKNPSGIYRYEGDIGDGLYRLSNEGKETITFCDMASVSNEGWTLIASNGELSASKPCEQCIGCGSNNPGCGSVDPKLLSDFTMPSAYQETISWSKLAFVAYGDNGYTTDKLASFGIDFGSAQKTTESRFGGTPTTPFGLSTIRCDGVGGFTNYRRTTHCDSKDLGRTKFSVGGGSSNDNSYLSFMDVTGYDNQIGVDDYQDGCGCGDSWSPKSVKGGRAAVFIL